MEPAENKEPAAQGGFVSDYLWEKHVWPELWPKLLIGGVAVLALGYLLGARRGLN